MSKMVICKNCGGQYLDDAEKCPYCGTMHKKGAYRKFRQKISDIINQMFGIKNDIEASTSKVVVSSLLKGLLLVIFVIVLAYVLSLFANTNYYNDKEYDEKRLNEIIWHNENISKLNIAYEENDFDTIDKLYDQNSSVVYKWQHFSSYYFRKQFYRINNDMQNNFNEYILGDCLYYLFYPEYFARTSTMSEEELVDFETMQAEILKSLNEKGYSEEELLFIYEENKSEYGYLTSMDLKKYVKGAGNG